MSPIHRHRGYVLPLTLLLLAMAAIALSTTVLRSMSAAVEALDAAEELQRRWGTISCQESVLPRAPALLRQAEKLARRPLPATTFSFALGGQRFDLTLADEQAKLNVNLLYDHLGRMGLERAIGEMRAADTKPSLRPLRPQNAEAAARPPVSQQGSGAARPASNPAQSPAKPPAFVSFAQVFPTASAHDLLAGDRASIASRLTCWGTPRLNIARAPASAIDQLLTPPFSRLELRKLLELRDAGPDRTVAQILDEMALGEDKRVEVERMLTVRSRCFSVWIVNRGVRGDFHRLAVVEPAGAASRTSVFEW